MMTNRVALYSAVDETFTHYVVDVEAATLTPRASIELPARLQYAWPHPSRKYLYATTSSGGPRVQSDFNRVCTLAIAGDGTLSPHGEARPLPGRAVHMCVDPGGRHAVNVLNTPTNGMAIHRIEADGSLGREIEQSGTFDWGIYPHQVMVFPSGRTVLIVDRGFQPQADRPERPGALRSFGFDDGVLSPGPVVAPNGGYGFGPRHVDFHPTRPWLYVSDERTNRLYMFRHANDRLEPEPAYTRDLLAEPGNLRPRQLGGPIHVHPSGRFVYVANRADQAIEVDGSRLFGGGENSIAVFAIDQVTGEPTPIQHADTHSIHVRTFACDPGGRLLVAGSIRPLARRDGDRIEQVPAALSVFRIGDDGRLEFARRYDVATTGSQLHYWMGMVGLP